MASPDATAVLARFQTRKVRSWRSAYKRIFCLSRSSCLTVDPATLTVTNVYPYATLTKVETSPSDAEEFILEADGSGQLKFKCRWRAELLTELTRLQTLASFGPGGWHSSPYAHAAVAAQRLRRGGGRGGCLLVAAPHALVELSHEWSVLQEYRYLHIEALSYTEDDPHALTVRHTGRNRIFMCQGRETLLKAARMNASGIGVHLDVSPPRRLEQVKKEKAAYHSCAQRPPPSASFRVDKPSRRRGGALAPRKLEVRDVWLVEMDAPSYAVVWARRLLDVFALVRSNDSHRELCIEFMDGTSRAYTCAERDALLACVMDAAGAVGNERIMLSTGVSDTLRLLPRHVTEQQAAAEDFISSGGTAGQAGAAAAATAAAAAAATSAANLYQSVFGNVTVELWCLRRLGRAAAAATATGPGAAGAAAAAAGAPLTPQGGGADADSLLAAAAEFNANVEVAGIARGTDPKAVRPALVGVVAALATLAVDMARSSPQGRSALYSDAATLLQSLCRILPSAHAFQGFVEACGADGFATLVRLLRCSDALVAFWTLRALKLLVACPYRPVNLRAEFVNKQVLLGTKPVCESLASLLRQPDEAEDAAEDASGSAAATADAAAENNGTVATASLTTGTAAADAAAAGANGPQADGVMPAPLPGAGVQLLGPIGAPAAGGTVIAAAHLAAGNGAAPPVKRRGSKVAAAAGAGDGGQGQGILVVMAASELLESVLVARKETTSPAVFSQVLAVVGRRHAVLMDMLRSPCGRVVENGILLMQVLSENAPQAALNLQDMALSQALVLRHFHHACFSPSKYQRFISRWLCALWMSSASSGSTSNATGSGGDKGAADGDGAAATVRANGNGAAAAAAAAATPSAGQSLSPGKELLQRLLPSGMMQYLRMPPLSSAELQCLDELEDEIFARGGGSGRLAAGSGGSRGGDKSAAPGAVAVPRLGQASKPGPMSPPMAMAFGSAPSSTANSPPGDALSITSPVSPVESAGSPAAGLSPKPVAAAGPAVAAAAASGAGGGENFRVLFHMLLQDQSLPDLIWNQETRQELRVQVEEGLRGFERQQQLRGVGAVAWNAADFRVGYASLRGEPAVGGMSMSRFLEASDAFLLSSIAEPGRFADLLFRRVLCEWQERPPLARQCLQCLDRLYGLQAATIGPFEDVPVLVSMIRQCTDVETQHRLLQLLATLCACHPGNLAPLLLEPAAASLLLDLAAQAHWAEESAGNALARHMLRARNATLAITGGDSGSRGSGAGSSGGNGGGSSRGSGVPDAECPRLWHLAAASPCPPPAQGVLGPVLLSSLRDMYRRGEVSELTLVAAGEVVGDYETTGTAESESGHANIVVDTGRWRPLGEVFQLRCAVMATGRRVLSHVEVSLLAMGILRRLVAAQPSNDAQGVPYWPLPRGKRLLGTPQALASLATLLLSPHAPVAAAAASLLEDVCAYNPPAVQKLYVTGAFFFALLQPGSNAGAMASLLTATHLRQHHLVSGAAVAEGLPLRERSFLGHILPEAMIVTLDRYGPAKFAEVFIGDYDTPEVIWNGGMRQHLCEMLSQHLGDFPLRLRQQPSAPYQYCPLPSIKYRALEGETYLRGYYLRGLCDTKRFPDWPVSEPAAVLRAVVEAWLAAMARRAAAAADGGEEGVGGGGGNGGNGARGLGFTATTAAAALGVERGCDGAALRKAYRSMARKYHPDKNPQGRDQFVRVQEAYELLLELEAGGDGGGVGGGPEGAGGGGGSSGAGSVVVILQLMAVQVALCRRYGEQLRSYKYPAYPLALQVVAMAKEYGVDAAPPAKSPTTPVVDSDASDEDDEAAGAGAKAKPQPPAAAAALATGPKLLLGSFELVSVTCALNELNAEEFARCGGCPPLLSVLSGLVDTALRTAAPTGGAGKRYRATLEAATHTLAVMSRLPDCREALAGAGSDPLSARGNGKDAFSAPAAAQAPAARRLAEDIACLLGVAQPSAAGSDGGSPSGENREREADGSGSGDENGGGAAAETSLALVVLDEAEAAAAGAASVARLAAVPLVASQYCLQAVCGLCKHEGLGGALAAAGVLWRLLPLMLRFDASLNETAPPPSAQVSRAQTQYAANATAAMATWALASLGGYMLDDMATPQRPDVRVAAAALLTPQLAVLLRNRDTRELLTCLNSTVQRATRMWLPAMRRELEQCVAERMRRRGGGKARFSDDSELAAVAAGFEFEALRGEQQVCGVYLRLFNADPDSSIPELESGDRLCAGLVAEMRRLMPEPMPAGGAAAVAAAMGGGLEVAVEGGSSGDESGYSEGAKAQAAAAVAPWWTFPPFLACLQAFRHLLLHPIKGPLCVTVLTDAGRARRSSTADRSGSGSGVSDGYRPEEEAGAATTGNGGEGAAAGGGGLDVLFRLLEAPPSSAAFGLACEVLEFHAASEAFAEAVVAQGQLGRLVRLLAVKPPQQGPGGGGGSSGDGAGPRWRLLDSLCATPGTAVELLRTGAAVLFVGMLAAAPPLAAAFSDRLGAAGTLRRLSWDPAVGPAALAMLAAFLPDALVQALQQEPAQALALFDGEHETPELIWTAEMRSELRTALRPFVAQLLGPGYFDGGYDNYKFSGGNKSSREFSLPPGFKVRYRALEAEIFLGGVYLRLFLQTPTHDIRHPEAFLEKLMDAWITECTAVLPGASYGWSNGLGEAGRRAGGGSGGGGGGGTGGSTALTLGREDLLTLYTSAVVYVLKRRGGLATRFVDWGFAPRVLALLRRAIDAGARGTPQVSCVRILHELAPWRPAAEAMIAADESVLWLLCRCLGPPLPRDAAFVVECAKRLVVLTPEPRGFEAMAGTALASGIVFFFVMEVLESSELSAGVVWDPSALKVHTVELLKALACHPLLAERVAEELDAIPAWRKYKHQDHDLFIAVESKADYFLTADTEALGRKLLTAAASGPPPPSPPPRRQSTPPPPYGSPPPRLPNAATADGLASPFIASPPTPSASRDWDLERAPGIGATSVSGGWAGAGDPLSGILGMQQQQQGAGAVAVAGSATHSRTGSAASAGAHGGGPGGGGPGSALHVTVTKDPALGLGIDVRREGESMVVKAVKPEARFVGPRQLQEGDVIAAVDGVVCETFAKGVRLLKAAQGDIHLLVSRRCR